MTQSTPLHRRLFRHAPRAFILFLLAAAAWFFWRPPGSTAVEVTHPQRGPAAQTVYATGTVEASVMMPIAPRIGARLMALLTDEGEKVEKGQTLARLEDDNLRRELEGLRAREDFARKQYERSSEMVTRRAISTEAYERAVADWEAAKAATGKASTEASFFSLAAPDHGRIIQRDGEIGQMIPANQPVFWLATDAPLRITAEVDEEDIPLVEVGQRVLIRTDAFPDRIFHGEVQQITPRGDPVARSYRVRVALAEEVPLRIGMAVETNIMTRENPDALLLPISALSKERPYHVWLVRNGHAHRQEVEVGARGRNQAEIITGVTEEDRVVLYPPATLEEGRKLRAAFTDWRPTETR